MVGPYGRFGGRLGFRHLGLHTPASVRAPGRKLQTRDCRGGGAGPPSVLEVMPLAHVQDELRPERDQAIRARRAHALIHDAAGAGAAQVPGKSLGSTIIRRVMPLWKAPRGPDVMESFVKAGAILPHLDRHWRSSHLLELAPSMIGCLRMGSWQRKRGVPGAEPMVGEPTAVVRGMAERGHCDRCRRSNHPLRLRDEREQPKLSLQPVVRPAFKLDDRGKVARRRNRVENARRWVAAGNQPMGGPDTNPSPRRRG